MKKKITYLAILVFCIMLATSFISSRSLRHDFWIGYVIYFFLTLFLINKYPKQERTILLTIVLTILGLTGLAWIVDRCPPDVGFPNILATLVATLCAAAFLRVKSKLSKALIVLVSLVICIFYVHSGETYWLDYLNYGTITGRVHEKVAPDWRASIYQNNSIDTNNLKGKFILLDFFSTSCGICFAEFPEYQVCYDRYKTNANIAIFAVNSPLKRDTAGMALHMLTSRGYTFPMLMGGSKLNSMFGVYAFPVIILLKDNDIIYRGGTNNLNKILEEKLR